MASAALRRTLDKRTLGVRVPCPGIARCSTTGTRPVRVGAQRLRGLRAGRRGREGSTRAREPDDTGGPGGESPSVGRAALAAPSHGSRISAEVQARLSGQVTLARRGPCSGLACATSMRARSRRPQLLPRDRGGVPADSCSCDDRRASGAGPRERVGASPSVIGGSCGYACGVG